MFLLPGIACVLFSLTYLGVNGDAHPNSVLLPEECGFINENRLIRSNYAGLYEFPWMALIFRYGKDGGRQLVCTGTVINQWYVLTAGHCAKNGMVSQVRIGDYDTQQDVDCDGQSQTPLCEDQFQEIDIAEKILHENYTSKEHLNDIALLRLKEPIDLSHKNAAPVCLPTTVELQSKVKPGEEVIIAGWEWMVNGETNSKMLKVNVPIKNATECDSSSLNSKRKIQDQEICTGGDEAVCPMRSGSALMMPCKVKGDVFRYVQYGLATYGTTQCNADSWTVFVNVSKYSDWILDHLRA